MDYDGVGSGKFGLSKHLTKHYALLFPSFPNCSFFSVQYS